MMTNICENCRHRPVCRYQEPCEECNQFVPNIYANPTPVTHADRIRSMDNENLAWLLMDFRIDAFRKSYSDEHTLPDTQEKICEWLQRPAEEDT